ncbi:hypothetical protein AAFH68_41390 [Flavobacterium sp. CGRL1]
MKIKEIWTTELKNGIFGGLIPLQDPFDKTKFYLSDGWGSAFPSMKLRKLSFENGKELNTALIRNSVRCLYFNPDKQNIFAVSDNKIFQINRTDLTTIKKFEKGIQKYSNFISSNDTDSLLLTSGDFIFIYNYLEEKGIKKKLKSGRNIYKESSNLFLIFCPKEGSIKQFDISTKKSKEILKTDLFFNSYKSKSEKIYLHLQRPAQTIQNTQETIAQINQINIYSNFQLAVEIKFDFNFENFVISETEEYIYITNKNQIWIYSLSKKQIIEQIKLNEKARIAQIFDEQQVFISYEYDKPNIITCWKFLW